MPELDGISALPLLLEKQRDLVVIMASTLTRRNAEVSLQGAVARRRRLHPQARDQPRGHDLGDVPARADREDPALGARRKRALPRRMPRAAIRRCAGSAAAAAAASNGAPRGRAGAAAVQAAAVLADAAARAADRLLDRRTAGADRAGRAARRRCIDRAPVLITQHMPPTFTTILAEHLARAGGRAGARGASTASRSLAGTIYLAPGGRHMRSRAATAPP